MTMSSACAFKHGWILLAAGTGSKIGIRIEENFDA